MIENDTVKENNSKVEVVGNENRAILSKMVKRNRTSLSHTKHPYKTNNNKKNSIVSLSYLFIPYQTPLVIFHNK